MTQERTTKEALEHATLFVGINKISKKNAKLFNKRLKILKFAGLHIFDGIKLTDIQEHIGLSTDAKKMTPSEFKSIVWQSMEEGAEILVKEEDQDEDGKEEGNTTSTPTDEEPTDDNPKNSDWLLQGKYLEIKSEPNNTYSIL